MNDDRRRALPSVEAVTRQAEALLRHSALAPGLHGLFTALARQELGRLRRPTPVGAGGAAGAGELAVRVARTAAGLLSGRLESVINATGVVLQTNLGRAPLSEEALARLLAVGRGYSNLEFDLESGSRAERARSLSDSFEALLRAPALVVNNNAAALLLTLAALARGHEVIVSRGELIEIGGSFRLPDVMRLSGARLVEVGTTNRTRAADYAAAIGPRTAAILKVHTSNYRVVGFTEAASTAQLARLAHDHGLVLVEDLGSGSLLATEAAGLGYEPTVIDVLGAGADLVTFSGDKLLGGPQAGIIAGRDDLVARLRRNALYRAVRPDKLALAALEGTLASYLRGTAARDLPLWRMLKMSAATTRKRARAWAADLDPPARARCAVVAAESVVGGGSLPGEVIEGFCLSVSGGAGGPSAARLSERLRRHRPPVIARIHEDRVILDPRTVSPDQDAVVVEALRQSLA